MKKTITAILLGILLVGILGAAVVSAVASNNTTANAVTRHSADSLKKIIFFPLSFFVFTS